MASVCDTGLSIGFKLIENQIYDTIEWREKIGEAVKKESNTEKIDKEIFCTYIFYFRYNINQNWLRFWYILDFIEEILSFQ